MPELKGSDRQYLRSLAHSLEPVVFVGKQGLTDSLVNAVIEALDSHELVKIKFNDRKGEKKEIAAEIAQRTDGHVVGMVGNVATLYRQHPEEEKRRVRLPKGAE